MYHISNANNHNCIVLYVLSYSNTRIINPYMFVGDANRKHILSSSESIALNRCTNQARDAISHLKNFELPQMLILSGRPQDERDGCYVLYLLYDLVVTGLT